jgi:hypothetical protein
MKSADYASSQYNTGIIRKQTRASRTPSTVSYMPPARALQKYLLAYTDTYFFVTSSFNKGRSEKKVNCDVIC